MNSSYPGAPGRGGTSLGIPPAQVGQVSATNPENELHPASAADKASAATSIGARLVVTAVNVAPQCFGIGPDVMVPTNLVARVTAVSDPSRNREAASWRDCVGGGARAGANSIPLPPKIC